ncbi:MAG: hypothetical protein ACWGOX_10395 [Desulforhopalus sp.]
MVYNYLLDLYKVLDKRKQQIDDERPRSSEDSARECYQQGRHAAINDFKLFLQQNYHEKLPRRVQKQYNETS